MNFLREAKLVSATWSIAIYTKIL